MTITKFELEQPDEDDDCSVDLEFDVTNNCEAEVFLVKHDSLYYNKKGVLVACDYGNSEDCLLDPGDTESFSGYGSVKGKYFKDDGDVTVRVQARFFEREFFKFGPFKVPDIGEVECVEADIDSSSIENILKLAITSVPPDDDGDSSVNIRCGITNKTDTFLESPELEVTVFDRSGAEIGDSSSAQDLPAHATALLDPDIWGLSPKQLKGATIECRVKIFRHVGDSKLEKTIKVEL
jgi:hypothetical protein